MQLYFYWILSHSQFMVIFCFDALYSHIFLHFCQAQKGVERWGSFGLQGSVILGVFKGWMLCQGHVCGQHHSQSVPVLFTSIRGI